MPSTPAAANRIPQSLRLCALFAFYGAPTSPSPYHIDTVRAKSFNLARPFQSQWTGDEVWRKQCLSLNDLSSNRSLVITGSVKLVFKASPNVEKVFVNN